MLGIFIILHGWSKPATSTTAIYNSIHTIIHNAYIAKCCHLHHTVAAMWIHYSRTDEYMALKALLHFSLKRRIEAPMNILYMNCTVLCKYTYCIHVITHSCCSYMLYNDVCFCFVCNTLSHVFSDLSKHGGHSSVHFTKLYQHWLGNEYSKWHSCKNNQEQTRKWRH